MSSSIEERLAAALEARADLVRPEDLRPIEVPRVRRRPPAGLLLLAAAVTAAVLATPFLLQDGSRTAPAPGPAGSPSVSEPSAPAPSESSEPEVPSDVVVVRRLRADVDGDGQRDRVQVLVDAPTPDEAGEGFVEVSLGAGGTGVARVPAGYPGPVHDALDLNGDGRDQILVAFTQGGDSAPLLVFTWHDGELVLTTREGKAPLGSEEGGGYVAGYYTQDGGLFSWSTRDLAGPTHIVDEWSWSVVGDRLVSTPLGKSCVTTIAPSEPVLPC